MPLSPGLRLGPYEVGALVGAGGMGEVYRAVDQRLGRTVAIKVLPPAVAADPERRARFEREARTVGALSHPNVVAIHDVGRFRLEPASADQGLGVEGVSASQGEEVTFLVMELLEGETLRSRLSPGSGLPRKKALDIAAQVAQGLAPAHARGIVHRDLKPENIFVTTDGRVKILDFGLARALGSGLPDAETRTSPGANAGATQPGMVMGTVGYMAPEQVLGKEANHRADIFALGVVLFEMLTGARAFASESPIETMSAILSQDPFERRDVSAAIPADAQGLIRHCLEKQPEERFESARDLAFQLQALASGSTTSDAAATVEAPARSRRWWLLAAGIALFAVGVAVGLMLRRAPANVSAQSVSFTVEPPAGASVGLIGGTMSMAARPPVAVSPDGTKIVFRANANNTGVGKLYVRTLARADAQPIEGTDNALYPFFSADGSRLAFCQDSRLKHVSLDGGPAEVVAPCTAPRGPGSWHRDGRILLAGSYGGALTLIDGAETTNELPSEFHESGCAYFTPSWLPDGRHYVVVKYAPLTPLVQCEGLYRGAVGSSELTTIIDGRVEAAATVGSTVLYVRDGSLYHQSLDGANWLPVGERVLVATGVVSVAAGTGTIAYAARPTAKPHRFGVGNRIAWFERGADRNPVAYLGDPGGFGDPRISPDERSLIVTSLTATGGQEGVIYDIRTGVPNSLKDHGVTGLFSPNNQSLLYLGANESLMIREMASGQTREFRGPKGERLTQPQDWFQDWIVAAGIPSGLHAIDVTGKSAPIPIATPATGGGGSQAKFSPDGKWVAFTSTSRIYVAPFPVLGARRPVAAIGGATPRWRDDGGELYFTTTGEIEDRMLMAVPVTYPASGIAFGAPVPLFKIPALLRNWAYDVTKDGKRFVAVIAAERDPVSITVLLSPPGLGK
jgi:serine/threonine protein kinase